MATGFQKVGNEWYYFHEDGGMNLGDLGLIMRYIPFRQKVLLPEPHGRKIREEEPILQAAMIRRGRFCLSIYAMKSGISILTPDLPGT